jgi:SAM-dependent methyltransferase
MACMFEFATNTTPSESPFVTCCSFLRVAKRSKAKRGGTEKAPGSNADHKRLHRALRTLDLVDSRLEDFDWADQVRRYVGDDIVDEWLDLDSGTHDDVYDYTYSSFERAMHFSVGWRSWPLTLECEWMLPRLRDAVARSGHEEPVLVEIGAGAGAAAALLSAALKVPVIAIDSHPKTLGLAEQFASRTGGTVESRVADIADLATVLDGRVPAAVFGLGIYRHLQPHNHAAPSLSDWAQMQRILSTFEVAPQVAKFIEALGGADLLLAEMSCPDYLAEVAAGLAKFGYEIPLGGIKKIEGATPNGPTVAFGIHFTTVDLPKRDPNLLIEMCGPNPQPFAYAETDADDTMAAEALRLSLEPTELIEAGECVYKNGSGRLRREVFAWGDDLIGHYTSSSQRNFRHLKFYPKDDLEAVLKQIHEQEAANEEAGVVSLRPCRLPASMWGGPLDTAAQSSPA